MDDIHQLSSYLCVTCGKVSVRNLSGAVSLEDENGRRVKGLITGARHLVRNSNKNHLLGNGPEEEALVSQWLEYRVTVVDNAVLEKDINNTIQEVNSYLVDKVYLVGHHLTLADILLYQGMHSLMAEMTFYDKQRNINLSRWFNQVQHTTGLQDNRSKIYFQKNLIYSKGTHS